VPAATVGVVGVIAIERSTTGGGPSPPPLPPHATSPTQTSHTRDVRTTRGECISPGVSKCASGIQPIWVSNKQQITFEMTACLRDRHRLIAHSGRYRGRCLHGA